MNTNVLAGLACPKCGSEGPFRIVATCWVEVEDDGVTDGWEYEWTDNSACVCVACIYSGKVRDYEPKRKKGSGNPKGNVGGKGRKK